MSGLFKYARLFRFAVLFPLVLLSTAAWAEPFEVLFIGQQIVDNQNCISVTFSAPVDGKKDFNRFMALYAKETGAVDGAWVLTPKATVAYFVNIEADTQYEVQVREGLRAADGKTLKHATTHNVRTRKAQSFISFADNGYILPSELSAGLAVNTLNVAAADVDFFRVKPKHYVDFVGYFGNRGEINFYDANMLERFTELVYSARFDLEAPKNVRARELLPVDHIKPLEVPGIYLATIRPAGTYRYNTSAAYFTISDIGLHLRAYNGEMEIQAQRLSTGKAFADVALALYDKDGDLLEQRQCDKQGRAVFSDLKDKARLLVAAKGDDFSILPLNTPALDLSAFDLGMRPHREQELFVYGPRDLYRPDETVVFDALLRDYDGRATGAVPPLDVTIKQPDGREVKSFVWQGRPTGVYHYDYALPDGAQTGLWSAQFSLAGRLIQIYAFRVEDFMPERMKLTLDNGDREPARRLADSGIQMAVQADYLYGAPAAGNRVECRVSATALRNLLPGLPDFEFGDVDEKAHDEFETDPLILDDQGKGSISVENRWVNIKSPVKVRLHASLFESGGRPVSRDRVYHFWPAGELVGVRPLWSGDQPDADSLVSFEVVRANAAGERLAAEDLDVALVREYPDYYWEYSESTGWERIVNHQHYAVARYGLSIRAGETASVNFPVEWGPYRLEIRDPATSLVTSYRFSAGWSWWGKGAEGQGSRPDQVVLTLDKSAYRPGETARVFIKAPEAGTALVTVEADRLLWRKVLAVDAGGAAVDIPVDQTWDRHDIYVTAMVVRPGDRRKKITPKRTLGILHLPLDRGDRRLSVSLTAPAKTQPNRTLDVELAVDRPPGADPVYVTLAAVDVGVLNITQYETPDPADYFFNRRRYGVDCYDLYQRIMEGGPGPVARMRYGGDADLDLVRGGDKPMTDVRIVSLYERDIQVDADGRARVALDLPDFNGRLRLMAVAYGDRHYGSAHTEVTVAAPVVAEIAMPRFLAMGDQSLLALDIQNLSGMEQSLSVDLRADGPLELVEEASHKRELVLKDKQKVTLPYKVKAAELIGLGNIDLTLEGVRAEPAAEAVAIKRRWGLGTRPAYPAVTRQWRKALEPGRHLEIPPSVLEGLLTGSVQAGLTLSDQPPIDIAAYIESLYAYPYGCLEQTVSGIYPQVFLTDALLSQLGVKSQSADERREKVAVGMDRLIGLQKPNGGFGLWSGESPEECWLTAYVCDFLISARDQGYAAPKDNLNKAVARLEEYLRIPQVIQARYSEEQQHFRLAVQAYGAFVLARLNKAPLGTLRTLFDNHSGDALSGLPLVHLGLALALQGDERRARQAFETSLTRVRQDDKYLGDYGSALRDAAFCYYLLRVHAPETKGLNNWLISLDDALRDRDWLSTQERNALALAGMQMLKGGGKTWQAVLKRGENSETVTAEGVMRRYLTAKDLEHGLRVESAGGGSLYVQLLMTGYSRRPPKAESRDLRIQRTYYNLKGEIISLDGLQGGDMALVRLDVSSDKRVSDALVVDLLPAGLELENQNLATSFKIDDLMVEDQSVRTWKEALSLAHEEFRDDRYVAAVDINQWRPTVLFYLARAVTPGTFNVPNAFVEDMYRPYLRAVGEPVQAITITQP